MLAETGWERDISGPRVIGKAVSEREFAWGRRRKQEDGGKEMRKVNGRIHFRHREMI